MDREDSRAGAVITLHARLLADAFQEGSIGPGRRLLRGQRRSVKQAGVSIHRRADDQLNQYSPGALLALWAVRPVATTVRIGPNLRGKHLGLGLDGVSIVVL